MIMSEIDAKFIRIDYYQTYIPSFINFLILGHTISQRLENWQCFWCKSADEGKIGCPPYFQSKDLVEFKHKDEIPSSFLNSIYMNKVDRQLIQVDRKNGQKE